ncbi:MAG: exodeoxyribonuclease VII large subunit [Actinomycetota bacterium]
MSQPAFEFDDEPLDDPADPTFTVAELADAINDRLRGGFGDGVWVRGEIDGLSNRGPHTYFSLVEDADNGRAVIQVQLFAPAKKRLTPLLKKHRLDLRDGMKVRIRGHLDFWAQGGRLGLKMFDLDPRYTLGELAQSRDEVLRRLVASGLIDRNRRTSLSPVPLRVGVATSIDSAAWADFAGELESSGFGFQLTVADTRVQGDGADRMVAGAIGTLARGARVGLLDVIVVIRGGGARNELAVFDSEVIARTIADVPVPVFTGLGHEIDRSIADEAAHTAWKTPTAVAGALVDRVGGYVAAAEMAWQAIERAGDVRLDRAGQRLTEVAHRIAARTEAAVDRADERLAMRATVLTSVAPAVLERGADWLDRAAERVVERSATAADRAGDRLDVLAARVGAVDPTVQLARGWSITRGADGSIVRSIHGLTPGTSLTTHLADGTAMSTVTDVRSIHDDPETGEPTAQSTTEPDPPLDPTPQGTTEPDPPLDPTPTENEPT